MRVALSLIRSGHSDQSSRKLWSCISMERNGLLNNKTRKSKTSVRER